MTSYVGIFLLCASAICLSREPNSRSNIPEHKAEQQPAPTTITTINNNTCAPNTGSSHNGSPEWYASPEWWLVILGFPTLFVLGWQANETRRAVNTARISAQATERSVGKMDEANRISRENMQAGQRAYVSFPLLDIQMLSYQDAHTGQIVRWEFRNAIENAGNTPAWNIIDHINARWEPGQAGLPNGFAFPDLGDERVFVSALAAKAKFYSAKLTIDNAIIRGVHEGNYRLYFYGWVTYRDVFEDTPLHRTEFCHEVRILEIVGPKLTLDINLHPQHNTQT